MKEKYQQQHVEVCAHWEGMSSPILMGILSATPGRGKQTFSFEYDLEWLAGPHALELDPDLRLFEGPQYPPDTKQNFGMFLDSAPDRWGRTLMDRREAQRAREEKRIKRNLLELDYLLGVYDQHRRGALRFRRNSYSPFLDDHGTMASPLWVRLRDLEYASLQLESDDAEEKLDYSKWLKMLIAPGGSLGGARPKAGVVDEKGSPWIAKFPSRQDTSDIGAWEYLVHKLAKRVGVVVPEVQIKVFSGAHRTFLSRRFDRTASGERIHFASALTLLGRADGEGASTGASYLNLAELLQARGARTTEDLQQLWTRIVFFMCVSNTDDHLRNHGFLRIKKGWALAPAYDMNPVSAGGGLTLNVSESDNSQDLNLAREVADYFRVDSANASKIISKVVTEVAKWQEIATELNIPRAEQERMSGAFRLASKNEL